jgi:DNA repair protein RadA/Sms
VLSKHTAVRVTALNVHVNVVGGYRVDPTETGLDLPLLAAVASSHLDAALPPRTLLVGEVGLRGELRHAPNTEVGGALGPALRVRKARGGRLP